MKTTDLKLEPKKRGRKSKDEYEQWLEEKTKQEEALSLYEKKMDVQIVTPLDQLRDELPRDPKWGGKKNSQGKNIF